MPGSEEKYRGGGQKTRGGLIVHSLEAVEHTKERQKAPRKKSVEKTNNKPTARREKKRRPKMNYKSRLGGQIGG